MRIRRSFEIMVNYAAKDGDENKERKRRKLAAKDGDEGDGGDSTPIASVQE